MVDVEIAKVGDLDSKELHAQWRNIFRKSAPTHLSRHLMLRILAYRLQADRLGDLDYETKRVLNGAITPDGTERARTIDHVLTRLMPGSVIRREWNGRMHQVTVLASGYRWNGKAYPSLSKIASAITGTRWNGPRFFGLRDKRPAKKSR